MDGQRLDDLARTFAVGVSRRRALGRLGGGLAGGALALLGLGQAAVRAQEAPVSSACSACLQCVNQFFAGCVSTCVRSDEFAPETCASACCEGTRTVCTILGECTATCTAPCPAA